MVWELTPPPQCKHCLQTIQLIPEDSPDIDGDDPYWVHDHSISVWCSESFSNMNQAELLVETWSDPK